MHRHFRMALTAPIVCVALVALDRPTRAATGGGGGGAPAPAQPAPSGSTGGIGAAPAGPTGGAAPSVARQPLIPSINNVPFGAPVEQLLAAFRVGPEALKAATPGDATLLGVDQTLEAPVPLYADVPANLRCLIVNGRFVSAQFRFDPNQFELLRQRYAQQFGQPVWVAPAPQQGLMWTSGDQNLSIEPSWVLISTQAYREHLQRINAGAEGQAPTNAAPPVMPGGPPPVGAGVPNGLPPGAQPPAAGQQPMNLGGLDPRGQRILQLQAQIAQLQGELAQELAAQRQQIEQAMRGGGQPQAGQPQPLGGAGLPQQQLPQLQPAPMQQQQPPAGAQQGNARPMSPLEQALIQKFAAQAQRAQGAVEPEDTVTIALLIYHLRTGQAPSLSWADQMLAPRQAALTGSRLKAFRSFWAQYVGTNWLKYGAPKTDSDVSGWFDMFMTMKTTARQERQNARTEAMVGSEEAWRKTVTAIAQRDTDQRAKEQASQVLIDAERAIWAAQGAVGR